MLALLIILASASAETDYYAGIAAYRAGDLVAARERFERVVEQLPPRAEFSVNAAYNLGRIEQRGGRPCEAAAWLERFVDAAREVDFVASDQVARARERLAEAHAECRAAEVERSPWSLGAALGQGAVFDGDARRGVVEVEGAAGRSLADWRLDAAVAIGVEPPAPALVRPGATWSRGPYRARLAAQVLVRPLVAFGALGGVGYAAPIDPAWTVEAALEAGGWPADGVVTAGLRFGIRWSR